MKRILFVAAAMLCATANHCPADEGTRGNLDIYFLDMVGGGSTLIVTPLGESVLIDTGSLEPRHRDADRIVEACRHAGVKHIDYLITTHFHSDHFGGMLDVSERIPIKCFMDKGSLPPGQEQDGKWFKTLYPLYQQATKATFQALKSPPAFKALYQIHYNTLYGDKGNTAGEFIANKQDPQKGEVIKVSADPTKGTFVVSIGVAGAKKEFSIQ